MIMIIKQLYIYISFFNMRIRNPKWKTKILLNESLKLMEPYFFTWGATFVFIYAHYKPNKSSRM